VQDRFALDLADLRSELWDQAAGLARSPADADDLVHDTIERALAHRHLFRAGSNLRAWTRSIMRNVFIDGWRRQTACVLVDVEGIPDDTAPAKDAEVGPLDVVGIEHVRFAAARLRAQDRELFVLAHVEGASYREIAARYHLPIRTVGTRLFRIRQKVRVILEQIWAQASAGDDLLRAAPRTKTPRPSIGDGHSQGALWELTDRLPRPKARADHGRGLLP